jgi:hypothetical protein
MAKPREPRWIERGDKKAKADRIVLTKLIPKIDMREPLSDDHDRDLLMRILTRAWRGADTREILYRLATGQSRPDERLRNREIARDYAVGLLNKRLPKDIKGGIAKEHELGKRQVGEIIRQQKTFIKSLLT